MLTLISLDEGHCLEQNCTYLVTIEGKDVDEVVFSMNIVPEVREVRLDEMGARGDYSSHLIVDEVYIEEPNVYILTFSSPVSL